MWNEWKSNGDCILKLWNVANTTKFVLPRHLLFENILMYCVPCNLFLKFALLGLKKALHFFYYSFYLNLQKPCALMPNAPSLIIVLTHYVGSLSTITKTLCFPLYSLRPHPPVGTMLRSGRSFGPGWPAVKRNFLRGRI